MFGGALEALLFMDSRALFGVCGFWIWDGVCGEMGAGLRFCHDVTGLIWRWVGECLRNWQSGIADNQHESWLGVDCWVERVGGRVGCQTGRKVSVGELEKGGMVR